MNDQALDRIGMSDRLDGFFMCFLCLFDGFCCVYILSSISNRVRKKNIGLLMLQVQRIPLLVSSLFLKLGLFASNKSGSLSI